MKAKTVFLSYDSNTLDIGKRIKNLREEQGMTQEELASKLGYKSRSTINKIESGINNLTQDKIKFFADALETSPEYLLGFVDDSDIDPSGVIYDLLSSIGYRVYSCDETSIEVVTREKLHYKLPQIYIDDLKEQVQQYAEFLLAKNLTEDNLIHVGDYVVQPEDASPLTK